MYGNLRFLYPSNPINPRVPDEMFLEEVDALKEVDLSILDGNLETESFKVRPQINPGDIIVYRGWMLSAVQYLNLCRGVHGQGGMMLTSYEKYLQCHHLPNWYPLLRKWTAETVVVEENADFASVMGQLGWGTYFVKDYVKSLKVGRGPFVHNIEQLQQTLEQMRYYRGAIEGGVCLRRVEMYEEGTEKRFFVFRGEPFSPEGGKVVPDILRHCAKVIDSPFFSVDIARNTEGEDRLVELGDGQVSDRVGWSAEAWARIFTSNCPTKE